MIPTKEMLNSVPFKYAADVAAGNIITGKYIKLAIERFYKWIEEAEKDGYTLNHSYGMHIIDFTHEFIPFTKHPDRTKIGYPFELSPYQQFTLYNVFGWVDKNGLRRINEVYESMAKKNGKTAIMAIVLLYHLAYDKEAGAEAYIGATKYEQAKLCLQQAIDFIDNSQKLRKLGFKTRINRVLFRNAIFNTDTQEFNVFTGVGRALGADKSTQDGINSSLTIIDEYHAHKDDGIKENLESSSVARTQPLTWHITTKGSNLFSVCKAYEDTCKDIFNEIVPDDDRRLIMIHEMDANDDWENPENWVKANPNWNVSVLPDNVHEGYKKAKIQPSKIFNFKTKSLNIWVDAEHIRIPDEIWSLGDAKVQIDNFRKYGCGGGMDLSSTIDLSAYVLVSNADPEGYRDILPFVFCPKDTIERRQKEDKVPYRYWSNMAMIDHLEFQSEEDKELYKYLFETNVLTATDGNQIDYDVIEKTILKTFWLHNVKWVDFDRWKSTELVQRLEKQGVEMYPVAQNAGFYSFPTQEFERLAFTGKLRHGKNPILKWMLGKIKVVYNVNEDMRYTKADHKGRIDAIIALIMGLSATITDDEPEKKESKYNDPEAEVSFGIDYTEETN